MTIQTLSKLSLIEKQLFTPLKNMAEKEAFKPQVIQKLKEMGHQIVLDKHLSVEEALLIDFKTKMIYGGSDYRRARGKQSVISY